MTGFTDPARAGDFVCGSSWQASAHTEQWWSSPEPDTDHVHVTREDPQAADGWTPDTSQGLPIEIGKAIGDALPQLEAREREAGT